VTLKAEYYFQTLKNFIRVDFWRSGQAKNANITFLIGPASADER